MIGPARIKVCGITRAADAAMALAQGADFLGINCWSGSPRFVPAAARATLLREIPADKRVAVTVNPTVAEAVALLAEGFAIVQAHFDPAKAECDPKALSAKLGWILAGGLGPDNIAAAAKSGASFFDLNSGVELAPGLKSVEKLAGVSEVLLKNTQS
ncbi:MAG: hypothetical protein EBV31_06195 [Verrucomicrobia bacterium]|nr:hypothetical protein [Verrucomicrobiota bacterium]